MDDRTVTGRVTAILDAVGGCDHPLSLAELTRVVGIPKPTVSRIAADLVARHMLARDADGGYRLGARLLELGARAVEQHGLRVAAAPYIQDLFARTGEISWISLITPTTFTLVDAAFGANRAEDIRRNGWPADLRTAAFLSTAAGRILAAERAEVTAPLRGSPLPRFTYATVTSWARMDSALQVVRDTGVAVEHEQLNVGFSCVATGIRSREGVLIGTLGVTGRSGSFDPVRLARVLASAGDSIAGAVSWQSDGGASAGV